MAKSTVFIKSFFAVLSNTIMAATLKRPRPRPHIVFQSQVSHGVASPTQIQMRSTFRSRNRICTNASGVPTP